METFIADTNSCVLMAISYAISALSLCLQVIYNNGAKPAADTVLTTLTYLFHSSILNYFEYLLVYQVNI